MWCCGSFFFAILCWSQCFFLVERIANWLGNTTNANAGNPAAWIYSWRFRMAALLQDPTDPTRSMLDVDGQNPARVVDLVNYPIHCNMFQPSQLASPKCCSIYPGVYTKNENGFAEVQSTLLSANGKFLPSNSDTSNSGFCGRTTSSAIA